MAVVRPAARPLPCQPSIRKRPAKRLLSIFASSTQFVPSSAKEAVECGTQQFEEKKYKEALRLYKAALDLNPSRDEARAAMYNAACAHVQLKQWQEAADAVKEAVNTYDLKVEVALKDPDLARLRERREWLDAQDDMVGLVARSTRLNLRSEARAPFRFARTTILGGLSIGASLGLIIITTRLVAALAGAPNAPELTETVQNFGINLAAVVVLLFFLRRDLASKARDVEVIDREERLSRLQIELGTGRVVPLGKFRGSVRPLVLAGSKGYINKCMDAVAPYKAELVKRGVSLVPVLLSDLDSEARLKALKAEMAREEKQRKGFGAAPVKTPEKPAAEAGEAAAAPLAQADKKWVLTAHMIPEWADWISAQKKEKGLANTGNAFIQVQLDGSIRSSGIGVPSFVDLVRDLPPLDDVRTRFMDGVGREAD